MRLQRWSRKRGMVWVGKDPFTLSNSLTGRGSQVGHPWAWATATPHPQGRIWLQGGQDIRSVQCSIPAWGGCGVTSQSSRRYQDWIAAASAGPATSAGLRPLAASSPGPVSPDSPPASLCDLFGVHQLFHGWSSLCRDTLALLREHLGTLGAVWVPSTRQAGPGWAWFRWKIRQKHFLLQKCWNWDHGREGHPILGETQPSPGHNLEQPDVTSKLSLLGDRGWTRDLLGSHPARITLWLCAQGGMASHHQKSWLYLWDLRAFIFQSPAVSCGIIRLVKTLLQTTCL